MITARRSWPGRPAAALAAGLIVLVGVQTSAHRRDEYLQAARIAVDRGRVEIELDLTPGIAVAQTVLGDIDRDRNAVVSTEEASAYTTRVLSELRLEVDGRPIRLRVSDTQFPLEQDVVKGEGTIQLRFTAETPQLVAGGHRVSFRNDHRPDIGVYLANALVPATPRVSVVAQRRDVDQRGLAIDYLLANEVHIPMGWWLFGGAIGFLAMAADGLSRRRLRARLKK